MKYRLIIEKLDDVDNIIKTSRCIVEEILVDNTEVDILKEVAKDLVDKFRECHNEESPFRNKI